MRPRRAVLGFLLLSTCLLACRRENAPHLPDDEAGQLVARAITAAGGWDTWMRHRDATFVSTLTLVDPGGDATSESIFVHDLPLHQGVKTRLASVGLSDEVIFGFDGEHEWMMYDGRGVADPQRTAFTRFHALSTAYWFALPFVLAELPCELTYLGTETDGDKTLAKVRVGVADSLPVPFDWMVLYFDAKTAEIERVHVHAIAEFLQHSLWVGVWGEERTAGGITFDRRRAFFPADPSGEIIGPMAAEQLIEHLRFDNGFAPEHFTRPAKMPGLTAEMES
jgi:hypothetical protein